MKKIIITDTTLALHTEGMSKLGFKEKTETAKLLDALGTDIIELGAISDKSDLLFLHTICPIIKNSTISCCAGLTEADADAAYEAISTAAKKRLYISVPTSTVQMEFICGKKPAAMLETVDTMCKKLVSLDAENELILVDATRSEREFLRSVIDTATSAGISNITVCDTAGTMLPDEMAQFVSDIKAFCPDSVKISVSLSDRMALANALSLAAVGAGAEGIKTGFCSDSCVDLVSVTKILSQRGEALGMCTGINTTALENTAEKIRIFTEKKPETTNARGTFTSPDGDDTVLSEYDTISDISAATKKLGYELSDEDSSRVYEEFLKVAAKKKVSLRELDAIIASVALQVPSTYKLKSFVINSGNIINATANIELVKNDEVVCGISVGDGPIDAAFLAIEKIIGHHFELDDFQIQSLTQGREAVGSAIVKLRSDSGRLYSGKGISTDIIGASIKAYINALNKICFEEH